MLNQGKKSSKEYAYNKTLRELLEAISECYMFSKGNSDNISLRQVADEFDFTHLKVRKLLITAGVYHTEISDEINHLKSSGKTIPQIMEITGLSRASVHSYLPYTKTVYNAEELSLNAERIRKYRERQAAVVKIEKCFEEGSKSHIQDLVWDAIIRFDSYPFHTNSGVKFRYTVKNQNFIINHKGADTITREEVSQALSYVLQMERVVEDSQALNISGCGYLYPVFKRLTIIR